ncbi:MAG TPA: ATP-binding protein, partial [Streptosporangiaceae bacterium]
MPQVLCPVLVGRDEEARRLRAALTAAGAGRGGTLFLAGEAGIGKTRLVREIARTAGEQGLTVLTGRAVAGGAPTPFRPFAEALTAAGRAGRLPAGPDLGPFQPVLGRLIPQWRPVPVQPAPGQLAPGQLAPVQPAPVQPVPGEESPVFLGEAVLRLLRALAPPAGCVLVLEDLHWADRETLGLLEYLADNLATERVLCLATVREDS